MLIGLSGDMTPIDSVFRSKVKVTLVFKKIRKNVFSLINLRTCNCIAFIFHVLINLREGMTPIGFVFTMSNDKITRVTYAKNVKRLLLRILRTTAYRVFICNMLIGLGEDINPIYFVLTRSKVKLPVVTV